MKQKKIFFIQQFINSINWRFGLILFFCTIIPLAIFSTVTLIIIKDLENKYVAAKIDDLMSEDKYFIKKQIGSAKERTLDFSSDGFIAEKAEEFERTGAKETQELLNRHLIINKMPTDGRLAGILILNRDTIVIGATNETELGKNVSSSIILPLCETDFNEEHEVKIIYPKNTYFSLEDTLFVITPLHIYINNEHEQLGYVVTIYYLDKLIYIKENETIPFITPLTGNITISVKKYLADVPTALCSQEDKNQTPQEEEIVQGITVKNIYKNKEAAMSCKNDGDEFSGISTNAENEEIRWFTHCLKEYDLVLVNEIDSKESKIIISSIYYLSMILLLGICLFIFFQYVYINKNIIMPIKQLKYITTQLKEGDYTVRSTIETGDELEELGNSINDVIIRLNKISQTQKEFEFAKRNFFSITSHELRSPMTPMRAQLQMLLKGYFGKLTSQQRTSLSVIEQNTKRLDSLVKDLLEISRIESGRLQFTFVKTSLGPHIKKLLIEMQAFMPEKKIHIISRIQKLPAMEIDPDKIMQILRNLLQNAIKFSSKNGTIYLSASKKEKMILFRVADRGIGIDPLYHNKIFDPFFSLSGLIKRENAGSGLGLAICKGIAMSQKGKIWVESALGKGATFYVEIPINPVKQVTPIQLAQVSLEPYTNQKIEQLFIDYLGPLGKQQFEEMKKPLDYKEICLKIEYLLNQAIINKKDAALFKRDVQNILAPNEITGKSATPS